MKVRKKVIVDAEKFDTSQPLPEGVRPSESSLRYEVWDKVQNGWVPGLKNGDYIMTGIKGERYPCDREVFEAQYEEV